MSNNYTKIYNTIEYAKAHNINPAEPETWDNDYRLRQMELAGIIPTIESEINSIKEGIKKDDKKNFKS
jgi:hypothetical protein